MEIQTDFKELLELFSVRNPRDNKHKVEYIIVGGYALALHGPSRFTGDIELLVRGSNGKMYDVDIEVS